MGRKRDSAGEIANWNTVAETCKRLGITNQTYFRWRKKYGGLKVDQAKLFEEYAQENARLRDELLNGEILHTLKKARVLIEI